MACFRAKSAQGFKSMTADVVLRHGAISDLPYELLPVAEIDLSLGMGEEGFANGFINLTHSRRCSQAKSIYPTLPILRLQFSVANQQSIALLLDDHRSIRQYELSLAI